MNEKYRSKYANQVEEFVKASGVFSDAKLGALLGVSRETVRQWRSIVPGKESRYQKEFAEAIERGKAAVNVKKVQQAMIKRACGYRFKKVTDVLSDKDGQTITTEQVVVQPDVNAAKFVLKNLGPAGERWQDKTETNLSGGLNLGLSDILAEITGDPLKPGVKEQ